MNGLRPVVVSSVLGALAGAAALVFAYAARPAIVLDMDTELSALARGFYPVERAPGGLTFAWTRERAELHLPGLDRRSPWVVTVRVRGARPDPALLPELRLAVDDTVVSATQTTNAFVEVTADVPASVENDRGVVLSLIVSSTFVPGPDDPRSLGVMVDEVRVAPASDAVVLPPRRALGAAMLSAGAFGGALATIGLTNIVSVGVAVVVALAQAVVMSGGLGPYEPYGGDMAWFAFAITLLLVAGVWIAERVTARRFRNTARFAVAFSAVVLFLELATLLHPSLPAGDALGQAQRFGWVLDGRYYFTSVAPGGYQFPDAIALYLVAAPFTLVVHGLPAHVDLLRTVVAVADALAGLLVYLMIVRASGDRLAGAIACGLFHLVPLNFQVQVAGTLTNAFAQSAFLVTLALVALGTVRAGSRRGLAIGVAAATVAALGHISTFAILVPVLAIVAVLFATIGGPVLRGSARTVAWLAVATLVLAVTLYYAHLLDAAREPFARITGELGRPVAESDPGGRSLGARLAVVPHHLLTYYGLPVLALAAAGTTWIVRRQQRDRLSLVLLAWALGCGAFLVLGVLTPVDMRPYLAFFPALAVLGGIGAAWMWRRGGAAQAAAGALLAWVVTRGVWEWLRPLAGWEY